MGILFFGAGSNFVAGRLVNEWWKVHAVADYRKFRKVAGTSDMYSGHLDDCLMQGSGFYDESIAILGRQAAVY